MLPSPLGRRRAGVEGKPREEPGMGLLNKRKVSSGGGQNLEKP